MNGINALAQNIFDNFQAVLKIWCFEKYHKNIRALFESTLKICQQNIGSRGERLTSRVRFNFTFLKFIASLAIFLVIIYLFYPVKSFLIDGELVPFVPIEVMFIDQSTMWGYCAVSCAMMTVGVYAIFGTEYMVLAFVMMIINYSLRVEMLLMDIEELNDLWRDTSTSTLAERHLFLRNICRKSIDMREYELEEKFLEFCISSSITRNFSDTSLKSRTFLTIKCTFSSSLPICLRYCACTKFVL